MGLPKPHPRRILLVENDDGAYSLVRDLLSPPCSSESTLYPIKDYDEALGALLTGGFDICLLCCRLGTRSAMEFLEEVIRSGCSTPVIFLTDPGDYETGFSAMKAGAVDYLAKDQLYAAPLERSMRYAMEIRRKNEAERALRESEERFRLVMEATDDGIWDWRIRTGEVRRNQAFFLMLGHPAEEYEGRVEEWRGLVHPDDIETVLSTLHDYLDGKLKKYDIEYRMLHKSGKVVWIHSRGKVVAFDQNGNPARMVGTHSNITRRKRAEEMLHLSEEKFAAAFANNPAAIVMTRLEDGLFFDVNDTWLALTGYDRREIIGNKARKTNIWPSKEAFYRFARELREKGFLRGWEQEFLKKSGERFVAQVSAQVLNVRGEDMVLATLVDITARRRAEEELQFHKTILEETGKIAKIGGWRFDALTGQGFWTEEVARIHDLDPALPISRDMAIQYYAGESREKIEIAVKEAVDLGTPYDLELEIVSAEGIRKWVRTIGHPVTRDGRVVEVKGSFQDISDRVETETALRDSVKEKTALLNEVHHRVKNNLQIVSSLLGLQAGRADNPQVLDILQDTRNRVRAMALLHETLYRSGNLAGINFATYVKDLCGQLLLSFGPAANRVKLEYEIARVGLPLKQAIPCGLIVGELVSNALKHAFTGKNSGRIGLRLDIIGRRTLALVVRDDGVGLSKSFDPTGASTLGIQLVSKLAGQLGGQLEVGPPRDGGAHFTVIFPIPGDSILQDES